VSVSRADFIAELRDRAAVSCRLAAALAITSFATFALVDPLLIDGSIQPLLTVRAAGIGLILALAATTFAGERFVRWSREVGIALCVVTSLVVILLTKMTGGGASNYHQALLITFFAFALFPLPWSSLVAGGVFGSMVIAYEVVMVAADVTGPLGTWVSNNAILWAAAIIATVLVHFSQQLRWEDFQNRTQLASAKERLEALDRAKSAFFANISHELRTPLTLALAPVQALLEESESLSEDQAQHLELVERNALRLLRLVDDLLALSRADAAALRPSAKAIPLRALVGELVNEAAPLAARKAIALELRSGLSLDPVHADPEHIERIVLNLLSNAVKFTPRGGAIHVDVIERDGGAEISVEDTGIGIPTDQLEQVFDRFHQVDDSSTRSRPGAGIGLALVAELVHLYGGKVVASSTLGEGTRIRVWLPRGVPSAAAEASPEENDKGMPEWHAALRRQDGYRLRHLEDVTERRLLPRARPQTRERTVLIVEDNPDMVRFLAALLAGDANILSATDGLTGLRLAQEHRPDLVISDVMMPGIDGIELVRRLRADPEMQSTPVLLLTARGGAADRVQGRDVGADAFLTKPFRAAELRAAARSLLQRRGASRQEARQQGFETIRYLAGGLTDELRTPLDAIDASLDGMAGDDPAPELETVRREVERLRTALDELERFAMGRSGPPIVDTLEDIAGRALHVAPPPDGRRMEAAFSSCPPVSVGTGEIERIVAHLLSNAYEATRVGGTITLRTWQEGDRVFLSVTDQGPGIPAEHAERIFAPYYSTRDDARGMGLALSRRLAERNGGTLELSPDGPGATFVLQLPMSAETP